MTTESTPAKVRFSGQLGLYQKRDHVAQGQHYVRHVDAMTRESLHSKSRIAGELAARDIELSEAKADIERLREHAVILAATAEQVERERCAALVESRAGVRGTGAWVALTAAADAIRGA